MKRHRSLHPLSEHHHHVLVQALEIRRAQEAPARRGPAASRRVARTLLRFWKQTGRKHFREEEEVLLPAYARHVPLDQDKAVVQMLADHAAIRASLGNLEQALATGRPVAAELAALGRRLREHVRLEEDQIFPRLEATLGEEELQALGQRLTRLHRAKKG